MTQRQITIPLNINTLLVVLLMVASFFLGSLWTRVQFLESGTRAAGGSTTAVGAPNTGGDLAAAGDVEPLRDIDHVKGNRDARILLIEYSDFECPFCKQFHPTAQQAVDEYDGEVAWVYRHFPLESIHRQAMTEAIASECVYEQGGDEAFWAFTDRVFEITPSNDGLDLDTLPELAASTGVDPAAFQTCLDNQATIDRVNADLTGGARAGVTGTPGNILLDTQTGESLLIPGAVPYPQVQQAIDQLLGA